MGIKKFEDILSWKKSQELGKEIYLLFKNCPDYSFKNQIQRATISISNNIAEGFERQTNKELRQFLYIAKGSAGEVRSMIYMSLQLKFIDQESFDKVYNKTIEISKLLSGLIKALTMNSK